MSANVAKAAARCERSGGWLRCRRWQRTCQRVESAALIMHIENAVMMIGTRGSGRKGQIAAALSSSNTFSVCS